jgi:hypothetical protein
MKQIPSRNAKLGRNDLCPCGSQLKYKKCCLPTEQKELISQQEIQKIRLGLKENTQNWIGNKTPSLFVEPDDQMIKMSEIIIELAEEFLDKVDTNKQRKVILELACLAWNIGVVVEQTEKFPDLDELIEDKMSIENTGVKEGLREILLALITKKLTNYAFIDRMIIDYKITDTKKDFRIDVVSIISSDEMIDPTRLRRI